MVTGITCFYVDRKLRQFAFKDCTLTGHALNDGLWKSDS